MTSEEEEYERKRESERITVALCSDVVSFRSPIISNESILMLKCRSHGMKYEPVNVRITSVLFCVVEDDVTESSTGMKKGDV